MTGFDFSYKGILASSLGVVVNVQPPRIRANERVEKKTVRGRSGVLHMRESEKEGEEVFDEIQLIPQCTLMLPDKANDVCGWLLGSGKLILGNDPLYYYEATAINAIPLNSILDGTDPVSFSPVFSCQPYRYLVTPAADIVKTVSGQSITNPGNTAAAPIIKVEGNGNIILTIGDSIVELEGVTGGIIIDSMVEDSFILDRSDYINDQMDGDFPIIPKGVSTLSWTGSVTKVTITPNWRWV